MTAAEHLAAAQRLLEIATWHLDNRDRLLGAPAPEWDAQVVIKHSSSPADGAAHLPALSADSPN